MGWVALGYVERHSPRVAVGMYGVYRVRNSCTGTALCVRALLFRFVRG